MMRSGSSRRTRWRRQSAISIPVLLAPALGPTLGGYIVQNFDWRLIFYINLPIGIVGLFMCTALLRSGRFNEHARLDILGLTLSTLAFSALIYGVGEVASNGWNSSTVIGFTIFGMISLIALIIVELRTDDPLLDFTMSTPTALIQLWLIGRSIGISFASQPASVIALSDIPPSKLARGSSFFTVLRLVSSAFVTSFLATYSNPIGFVKVGGDFSRGLRPQTPACANARSQPI